jgi:hypothetical protein
VTYNCPGNAFNLGRVTMKPDEQLRDYANRFFENCNTCVGVRDDHVVDSYKKGLRYRKVFEKIHESGATKVTPLMEVVNKYLSFEVVDFKSSYHAILGRHMLARFMVVPQ